MRKKRIHRKTLSFGEAIRRRATHRQRTAFDGNRSSERFSDDAASDAEVPKIAHFTDVEFPDIQ